MLDSSGSTPVPAAATPARARVGQRVILIFVRDDVSNAALRGGLADVDYELKVFRGGVEHGIRMLEKQVDGLHAIVVDVSTVDDPLAMLEDLARVCPPDVRVTVIGDNTEIGFYRTLIGMGVTEYLPKPLTRDTVFRVLRPKLAGETSVASGAAAQRGGTVVAVCGAQGGAGATSLTINLALLLSEQTKATVAILDLHLQDGEAAVMLGVRPGPGLRIALEDPMRADVLFLERSAIEVTPRVRLIGADEAIDDELDISVAGMRHVLSLLRSKFRYVIVDLPIPLIPAMRPVLESAQTVFVLLEGEVTGLRNAAGLRALITRIAGSTRMFTVLNRYGRPGTLSLETVKKGLGATPDVVIPDLGKRMTEAVNSGVPAIRKVSKLKRHLAPLVREIAGVDARASRSFLSRLFGR